MTVENHSETVDIGGDLTVHRLGFGAMRLTGDDVLGEPDDVDAARDVVSEALDAGVDLIDTADSYGPCASERIVGEAVARREAESDAADPVVATKGGLLRNAAGDWLPMGDPDYLGNALLGGLDRLRTDTVDLYQLHKPDPDVPFADSVRALAEFKDEGLVDHVGLSNVSVDQFDEARDVVEIATVQNEYNVADREDEAVLEACEDAGVGFVPWFPLGGGDLGDGAGAVEEVADVHDATPRQIALAWLLERSDVMLPIPGTSSVEHLRENVAATRIDLTDQEMARLDG